MKNPFIHLAVGLLRLYKLTLSPAFSALGIKCRYEPSCSSYSIDAFQRHGVWRGFWITLARLLRCHPWGSSGLDPVPECAHKHPFWTPWRYGDWSWRKNRDVSHDISCENKSAHKG
ncbi:MAG: membrane protein insertion efficiency factor YidD [Robiginitomaculum sp.]|nr:MAG: membrane protein insertion efficiency factor YidD [Robiginitomaculum sp.]